MSDALASTDELGTPPGVRLAEAWANFTKTLAIYPETNSRVRVGLEAWREALDLVAGVHPGQDIEVRFEDAHLRVAGEALEFRDSPALEWLRKRLDHAALCGVGFAADTPNASLISFSQKLLENYLRKDAQGEFRTLWPDRYAGIHLIDRRFVGTFGQQAGGSEIGGGDVGAGNSGGGEGTGDGAGGQGGSGSGGGGGGGYATDDDQFYIPGKGLPLDSGAFVSGLLGEEAIAARMERLHALIELTHPELGETDLKGSDIVRQLIDGLPADAVRDRGTLLGALGDALDELLRRNGETDAAAEEAAHANYVELLEKVSRTHFSRDGVDLQRLTREHGQGSSPTAGKGRPRDQEIVDDVESLMAEIEALPQHVEIDIARDGVVSPPELAAALLHYLVHLERPESLPSLERLLREVFDKPGPAELDVLRQVLEAAAKDEETGAGGVDALIRLLGRIGKTQLLRTSGLLQPDRIVASFPEHFGVYLSALDVACPNDLKELNSVCEQIGYGRVLDAADQLRPDLERLDPRTAGALLERPDAARLPLARLLLAIRSDVNVRQGAAFLRALDLPEREAFLLYQLPDGQFLTTDYLVSLIDQHMGRADEKTVRASVTDVLCKHIRGMREINPTDRERLNSIRSLARYPSPRGWHLLEELKQTRWGIFGANESLAVRRLARSVSKEYQRA